MLRFLILEPQGRLDLQERFQPLRMAVLAAVLIRLWLFSDRF